MFERGVSSNVPIPSCELAAGFGADPKDAAGEGVFVCIDIFSCEMCLSASRHRLDENS